MKSEGDCLGKVVKETRELRSAKLEWTLGSDDGEQKLVIHGLRCLWCRASAQLKI